MDPTPDDSQSPAERFAADDMLPPVEPPSAGFILQLFVIPGAIVVAIVAVWLMFSWIAHGAAARPEEVIQGLAGGGAARWQRASELADMLRDERYAEFKQNSAAAEQLAQILEREVDAAPADAGADDAGVTLRYFLCRALGEFHVADGLPILARIATSPSTSADHIVRRGAIQAMAVLADRLQDVDALPADERDRLESTLLELAGDDAALIRSEAAFALGQLGTPAAIDQLARLVNDPHADARYNAAVALAIQGRTEALETLAEMLDPDEMASVRDETHAQAQQFKRAVIMKNALEATQQLVEQQPRADYRQVRDALERIVAQAPSPTGIHPQTRSAAQRTLEYLEQHTADGAPE